VSRWQRLSTARALPRLVRGGFVGSAESGFGGSTSGNIQSVSIIGNEQYQWFTNIMSRHVAQIRAEERPRPGDRTQTPGPLHRDFDPPLMGGPAPATTSPGRNEAPTVTPLVVRDRASASVAEDSAGKLAAGPAPIERRVEPRRRRDAHEVSPLPDRAGDDSGRVL
jgi:hypothetical protein